MFTNSFILISFLKAHAKFIFYRHLTAGRQNAVMSLSDFIFTFVVSGTIAYLQIVIPANVQNVIICKTIKSK